VQAAVEALRLAKAQELAKPAMDEIPQLRPVAAGAPELRREELHFLHSERSRTTWAVAISQTRRTVTLEPLAPKYITVR